MLIITVFKYFTVQNKNTKRMAYFNDKKLDSHEQGKCFASSLSKWNTVVYLTQLEAKCGPLAVS